MKHRSASQPSSLSLPRGRGCKDTNEAARTKRSTKHLAKRTTQAVPFTASRHRMTLRSTSTCVSTNDRDNTACDSQTTTKPSSVDMSSLTALPTTEPVVRASSQKMPLGYSFVPKGDVYVTRNCRLRTRLAHQVVYVVVNDKKQQLGIRVPTHIHAAVLESAGATRDGRQRITKKRDEDLEKRVREAILERFPHIPPEEVRMIIRHATKKGKGRVGRTGRKGMAEKAYLATQAWIRHTKTDYEALLKNGTDRGVARIRTARNTFDVLNQWGLVTRREAKAARKPLKSKYAKKSARAMQAYSRWRKQLL